MEKASLFEHNEIGYKKLCNMLQNNKTATIDHATGTGKSFIALKYLYENRDKKYLYIAPTYPIIEQLKQSCYKIGLTPKDINIDTMIYRNLLGKNMDELYKQYDGIIFDEYHRTGAPETYKQIKRLKLNLIEHNDDKKFIGLTATPIRYLDNERNMTQEIFDGNVASKLTLSEAMIQDLLPIPVYVNSKIACLPEVIKTAKRISKLADTDEKRELKGRLYNTVKKIGSESSGINTTFKKYITKKDGKYIVFCNTIGDLKKYMENSKEWFKGFENVKKYEVHSHNSREENQQQLNEFNDKSEGMSVLFCVDILNEGVHVNDIDGVVLLRRTTSPIIYFQQIGRALSFSGRNKQITIFDMVNNFGNHNAIDAIYKEYEEVIRNKINQNPGEKAKYEELLSRFAIMDETKEIIKELSEINSEVTPEKIIKTRLDDAINKLSKRVKNGNFAIFENYDARGAYLYISKYARYVNDEQFQRLVDLKIILPETINMTIEERQELLKGYGSFYAKLADEKNIKTKQFYDFISCTGRRPDINSEDSEERKIASQFIDALPYLKKSQIPPIRDMMDNQKISYTSYEKAILEKKVNDQDVDDLIKNGLEYISANKPLPEHYRKAIQMVTLRYTLKKNDELFDILDKNDEITKEERAKSEQDRYDKLYKIMRTIEQSSELRDRDVEEKLKVLDYEELTLRDKENIKRKFSDVKKGYYQSLIKNSENSDMAEFCRKMRSGNGEYIESIRNVLRERL